MSCAQHVKVEYHGNTLCLAFIFLILFCRFFYIVLLNHCLRTKSFLTLQTIEKQLKSSTLVTKTVACSQTCFFFFLSTIRQRANKASPREQEPPPLSPPNPLAVNKLIPCGFYFYTRSVISKEKIVGLGTG